MKALGIIPARLQSTRLSEKVLKTLKGRPMIQHVWERAKQAKGLSEIMVACDDERVAACVKGFGGKAVMTRTDHPNGTSRVAEIAEREEAEVFINIQGDEPLIDPNAIDQLVEVFNRENQVHVATLAVRLEDPKILEDPNTVKVVCNQEGNALYFSRAPIPHTREKKGEPEPFLKHLGIYGYRKAFLLDFVKWKPSVLERKERLEQLRILERGFDIRVLETRYDSLSVDTEEDVERVEARMR